MGFLWLLLMKGIAEMHISTARPLRSQILMQGAMDNVTAPRCGTDLEFVNTTLSSAQLQSPPLPTSMFCICEKPMLKVQDKYNRASSGRGAHKTNSLDSNMPS